MVRFLRTAIIAGFIAPAALLSQAGQEPQTPGQQAPGQPPGANDQQPPEDQRRSLGNTTVALDSAFLQKYASIYDTMQAHSQRGPTAWRTRSGQWIGIRGADTIKTPGVPISDVMVEDIPDRIWAIQQAVELKRAIAAAGWTPAEYEFLTQQVVQALTLAALEDKSGLEEAKRYSKEFDVTMHYANMAFVRQHREQLQKLGFTQADASNFKPQNLPPAGAAPVTP